ncbi:hypothetical protein EGW08_011185 [Elysia chlorotica]|uniref:Uncharacterized protein n=1 Tax=Elysia chlorotica TaxID=188477 RepID=A0A433THI8_ELYCH|nr:hypothetical protein EGW08_011185 [Elysia chlorotica]
MMETLNREYRFQKGDKSPEGPKGSNFPSKAPHWKDPLQVVRRSQATRDAHRHVREDFPKSETALPSTIGPALKALKALTSPQKLHTGKILYRLSEGARLQEMPLGIIHLGLGSCEVEWFSGSAANTAKCEPGPFSSQSSNTLCVKIPFFEGAVAIGKLNWSAHARRELRTLLSCGPIRAMEDSREAAIAWGDRKVLEGVKKCNK